LLHSAPAGAPPPTNGGKLTELAEAGSQPDRARASATGAITKIEAEYSAVLQQIAEASIYYCGELTAIDMSMDNQLPVRGGEACPSTTGSSLRRPGDRQSVSRCATRPSVVETSLTADTYPQWTSQRGRCAK
jgi:hypothetical protein